MIDRRDVDGTKLLREQDAADYVGHALRKFRKFSLPFRQPDGTRRKDQRLYRLDDLTAWRDEHGTYRDILARTARRTHTKQIYKGEPYTKSEHYDQWRKMVDRCTNPDNPRFADYGGRGITVHECWITDPIAYFAYVDSETRPDGYTLDRVDNDGHYEPGNLRFASVWEQNRNKRGVSQELDLERYDDPCCICSLGECQHTPETCPMEAFDWDAAGRAIRAARGVSAGARSFNRDQAERSYQRMLARPLVKLPDECSTCRVPARESALTT